MKASNKLAALIALACATMVNAHAAPQEAASQQSAQADSAYVNPDWANSAWYAGVGAGRSRADIDQSALQRTLNSNGSTLSSFNTDDRDVTWKLFVGKQLNRYFAIEAGYFELENFDFEAWTNRGNLNGETKFRGVNLDLVGRLPITERLTFLARGGVQYTKAKTHFTGSRLDAVTVANPPNEGRRHGKYGLGLEYALSENMALRGEVERYRVTDAVQNRGDIDTATVSLVWKFGRPVKAAYVAPAPVEAAPAPAPAPVVAPAPAPEPVRQGDRQAGRQGGTGRVHGEAGRPEHRSHDRRRPHRLGRHQRLQREAVAAPRRSRQGLHGLERPGSGPPVHRRQGRDPAGRRQRHRRRPRQEPPRDHRSGRHPYRHQVSLG